MPLSIKDPETDRLARELAQTTGESITDAVRHAIEERLNQVRKEGDREARIARMLEIGRKTRALIDEPITSTDHGDFLYDEFGLPK